MINSAPRRSELPLSAYLDQAIADCERRLQRLGLQHKIDRGYVRAKSADQAEIAYFRCQLDLQTAERRYLRSCLAILRKWQVIAAEPDFIGVVPAGEVRSPTAGADSRHRRRAGSGAKEQ